MAYENAFITLMLVGLVFFGSKKLPELARAGGRSQMEFEIARSASIKWREKEIPGRYLASNDINSDILDQLYWAKLGKAALRAGIQDPKHLTDEELVHAIMSYLEGKGECNNQHLSCKWWRGSGHLEAVRVKSIVYICSEGKKSIISLKVEGYDE